MATIKLFKALLISFPATVTGVTFALINSMSKKRIFYIIFFGLLVFAFFGALALAIPGYIKPKYTPLGTVQPFAFTTQEGNVFTEKDAIGKVTAVNYFFTTCRGVCPRMNNNLRTVYDALRNEKDFLLLSFTSDPERDSVPVLKQYSDSMQIDPSKWIMLTGRKDSLYNLARHSYRIDDPKNFVANPKDDFLHTQFLSLVNKKGEVVRLYDGLKPSEVAQMQEDITKLLKE